MSSEPRADRDPHPGLPADPRSERRARLASVIDEAAGGGHRAFAALFAWKAAPLASYLELMAVSPAARTEILTSVMVTVWRDLPRFDYRGSGDFDLWLIRLADETVGGPDDRHAEANSNLDGFARLPSRVREATALRTLFRLSRDETARVLAAPPEDIDRWEVLGLESAAATSERLAA